MLLLRILPLILAASIAFPCFAAESPRRPSLAELRRGFANPPEDCKIMVRWWWFGPSVTHAELEREMRFMKQGGIGGFEIQPVYPLSLDDPALGIRNLPFLSDDFIEALRFTSNKARELGLRLDLTLGSGWPFGGPHIPVTQAAGRLRVDRAPAPAGSPRLPLPEIGAGEKLLAVFLAPGEGKSFDLASLREITDVRGGAVYVPKGLQGPHVVFFFIASRTGQQVKRAAAGAEGFVLDHYDRAATDNHLRFVGDRMMQAFGAHPPRAIFSDSLEVFASDWTGGLLEQFRKRRGYDLRPYLPALVGDMGEKTGAIRNDWGRTLAELANERYLSPMTEWAHKHGTLFRSQTYGMPPVSLSSNALVDLPEGEQPYWRRFTASRWAASASHLYGRPVTSSETWTWLHSPSFRATPLDMKAEADLHFLQGINQLIGHGWPYSAESAEEPGWRFYASAVFNQHNPWWLVMPEVTGYLQRVSHLLRQGRPANDVALYLPTADARAQFTAAGRRVSISDSMNELLGGNVIPQILDAGYNLDFIDDEAIERLGIAYPVLVLPGVERIPLASYRKIAEFAAKGGTVVATRRVPALAPGLMEAPADGPKIAELSATIFKPGSKHAQLVADESRLGGALAGLFPPDFVTSPPRPEIGFIHRKLDAAEIYFLANTSNTRQQAEATFRVKDLEAEWWDPFTGQTEAAEVIPRSAAGATLRLDLEAYGSRVLVFSPVAGQPLPDPARRDGSVDRGSDDRGAVAPLDLSTGWTVTFKKLNRSIKMDRLRSWTDDEETRYFSGIAVYEKTIAVPEAFVRPGARAQLDFGEGTVLQPAAGRGPGMRAWLESPVREAAVVYVNGRRAGSVWRPPFQLEITALLHPGNNSLRIEVGNLGINALAGQTPPKYRLLNLRYGERFTPQDMDNLQPLPAGLLGPVRLVAR